MPPEEHNAVIGWNISIVGDFRILFERFIDTAESMLLICITMALA